MGALGDSSAVSVLCTALQDEAPGVRGSAATALGALGNSSAVSVLCAALQDEATNVRGSAATALGALGDRSAVSVLCTALQDEASNVRGSAATALGALGDRSAVSVLCAALQDDALNVRGSAATALGALGDRGAVTALCATLADGDAGVRGSAATALGALGDRSAVSELCAALTDGDAGVRGSAATALGALGDRSAVSALCAVLTDGDASVRGSATTALGALGDRSAVSALCSVLTDGDAGVRGAAAKALGTLGDRRALPPLYVRLGDDDAHVRSSTCLALGALADRGAVQPLCAALMDSDPFVRGSAASALGTLGDSEAVEALSALLADSEGQVRLSAVNALGVLISHQTIEGAISRLIVDAKHNSESSVRTSAVITLARNGRIDLPLVRYLLDPDFKRRDGRLRDTEWGVQGQTAAAVLHAYEKSVPDGEQLMIVARLLNEPDARREVVSAALAPLGDLPAPALRRALPHLAMYLPNPPSQVAARISQLQDKLAKYKQAERSLAELRSAPVKALRVAFPPTPRPWFETTTEPLYLAKKESSTLPRTAVILTAAPIEAKAVYQSLMDREVHLGEARVAGHVVDEGMLNVAGNSWRVVLAQPLLKGPHSMQSLVKDVLSELRPEIILMVGMCGGIRENRATEGAVIVAKQVLNYEPQRLRQNDRTLNPSNYRCDPRILGCVNALSRRGVLDRIGGDGEPAIEVLTKDIGSGEKLIDDLNSAERASIVALSGDMVGVEQEAHGLYHPLWEEPLRGAPPPYAMIKGISDLADGSMLEDKLARQTRATKRALAVALAIIQNFEPPLSSG
ncbi:HEAT repeat domain-containing protein [Bradyrhizobium oligotrophicum]|uniref:HEAT repeat domain-containing protein n=1 Tax=Bradyrhizobium TaxID=374 RepID=UPI0028E2D808|nr:HEAT repeat domain-containing protein [Bradyrhizobium sp. SZCCHNS3002]